MRGGLFALLFSIRSAPDNLQTMRIGLVHEFLTQYGGGERVLDAFLDVWPSAPVHTLVYDAKKVGEWYGTYDIRPSFIQKLPAPPPAGYKWFLPFFPTAIESFDLRNFDVVLSDSSAFAKGVRTHRPTVHVCYMHTPTRYLWSVTNDYLANAPIPGVIRPLMPPVFAYLRRWDFHAAQRPDYLIANSQTVAERIRTFYKREPDLILWPPVQTKRFQPAARIAIGDYWLVVARQEPYKRTDLAIQAASQLGLKLKVVGGGSNIEKFRRLAGPTIEFLGRVSDKEVAELMAHAIGLIHPQEEDAGITMLETMAAGRPVLAFGQGGASEVVIPGMTGELFSEQTVESVVAALSQFRPGQYDTKEIREFAEQFDVKIFQKKIQGAIAEAVARSKKQ